MTTVFQERTERCQQALQDAGAGGLVLFPSQNMYYLSGFTDEPMERQLFLFVPTEGEPVFVLPEMYDDHARDDSWVTDVRTWADGEDPLELVDAAFSDLDFGGRVLVDDQMWALFSQDLRTVLPDAEWGLASEVLDDLRMRKDEHELDALTRAGEIADRVVDDVRSLGEEAIGMTETDLAAEIESRLTGYGGQGVSFDVIVGSGPNGAKPHHRHGDRTIARGDPVVLDFGTVVEHYPSDTTRTVVFAGDPLEQFEAVYEVVLEAHHAGVDAVEPGIKAQEVDRAARAVIEDAGYGEQFLHRTGHGLGLNVHESPYIVEGNDQPLEPGMVFSVEPGIYLEGEFGVRIEDIVVVTGDGVRRLNDSPRTWSPG